jgi:Regulator of ribonuclease activity B
LDFYLYFPSRTVADMAAAELGEEGFNVVTRDEPEEGWLAVAGRDVSDDALEATEKRLRQVAESHGGTYEGFKGD